MQVFYKVVSTILPGNGSNRKRIWYPQLTGSSRVGFAEIAKIIEKRSTLTDIDITAVFCALQTVIPELLCDNKTVHLEDLGTFRLHAKVTTSDTEEEVSSKNIKEFRLSFIPDNKMKKLLQETKAAKI